MLYLFLVIEFWHDFFMRQKFRNRWNQARPDYLVMFDNIFIMIRKNFLKSKTEVYSFNKMLKLQP